MSSLGTAVHIIWALALTLGPVLPAGGVPWPHTSLANPILQQLVVKRGSAEGSGAGVRPASRLPTAVLRGGGVQQQQLTTTGDLNVLNGTPVPPSALNNKNKNDNNSTSSSVPPPKRLKLQDHMMM